MIYKSIKDLVVSKSDKGGQIVLLDKRAYVSKGDQLFIRRRLQKNTEVKKDPANTYFSVLKKIINKSVILCDIWMKQSLVPSAACCVTEFMLYLNFTKLTHLSDQLSQIWNCYLSTCEISGRFFSIICA